MNTKAFIGLALLLPALTFNLIGEDICLQVEGTITMRNLAVADRPEKILSKYTFTVTTDGKLWNMVFKKAPDFAGPADRRLFVESSYDGKSMRIRNRFPVPENVPKEKDGIPHFFVAEMLLINDRHLPDNEMGLPSGPLWLTYASGDFFQNLKQDRMTNVLSMMPPSLRSPEPEKCTFSLPEGTDWKTPEAITFLNEGFHWVKSPAGIMSKKEFPPPFNQGYVAYHLQVHTRINIDASTSIPGSVETSYFAPSAKAVETVKTDKVTVYEIQTTSAKKVDRPVSFHHQFKEPVSVIDYRVKLTNGKELQYMSQDGTVHELDSEGIKQAIRNKERTLGQRPFLEGL